MHSLPCEQFFTYNSFALRTAKTLQSFGCSECERVTGLKCMETLSYFYKGGQLP